MQSELFLYSDSLDNGPLFIGIKTDELFSKTEQFFAYYTYIGIVCHLLTPHFSFCQKWLDSRSAERIRSLNVALVKPMN